MSWAVAQIRGIMRSFLLISALLAAATSAPAQQTLPGKPSLVVLITVDQFRGDYPSRFSSQLRGGLARLTRGGAWFTNAHHDHAITETAPGHATLLSGRFPRSTGIMANRIGVDDPDAPLIDFPPGPGASPRRFRGTTLVDWVTASDKKSRTLSISMKDRAAILPVGRSRQQVYWYVANGEFTTSRYYADTLPTWLQRFNARHLPESYAGKSWTLLLPASEYSEPDSVPVEGAGTDFKFPHVLPADSAQAASAVRGTPWMDDLVVAAALDGVSALALGKGPQTDVLSISLSATDLIGHRYGPDSREMHDQILRLDRLIGVFVDSLYRLRDSSRIELAITGDHGVGIVPELVPASVKPTPERVTLYPLLAAIRHGLAATKVDTNAIFLDQQVLYIDRPAFKKAGVNADSVLDLFRKEALQVPGVARVDRFRALMADTLKDPIARRWAHEFPADEPVELVVTLTPYSIYGGIVATHGSPYDYDSHVPLIFYGPRFKPGRYAEFVRTVDLAPTLAEVAGVKPLERLDGVVLRRALK